MNNRIVQALYQTFVRRGFATLRFNFRGVGASQGSWAGGPGEIEDALAVVAALRAPGQPLWLAGFSFGAYVVSHVAAQLAAAAAGAERLVLVGPAASRFDMPPAPADTQARPSAPAATALRASVFFTTRTRTSCFRSPKRNAVICSTVNFEKDSSANAWESARPFCKFVTNSAFCVRFKANSRKLKSY